MKSRIFLLVIAFQILAGALIGQTGAPASTPAAQAASPAAPTPPSKPPAPAKNPPKSDSDESFPTIVHEVNEVRVVFTVNDRHGRYVKACVVGFDATPEVTQDFTDSTEGLSAGVRMLRAGGGTAMYDALYFACRDKLMKPPQTGPVRRAIILLSDGEDNLSHVTREEAIEMAERADVIVYTISTNISGMKGKGDKVLERIADATGGRAFFPFQMREVSDAFTSIQEELRSQYAVAYSPSNFVADGRYRTIDIMALEKGLKVRTRKGYYAPKQ